MASLLRHQQQEEEGALLPLLCFLQTRWERLLLHRLMEPPQQAPLRLPLLASAASEAGVHDRLWQQLRMLQRTINTAL